MAASIEVVQTFDTAIVVFEKYGLDDYMDMFEAVSFDDPNANDTQVLDQLQTNLMAVLRNLLVMQGLHPAEHTLPSQVVEFADAMYMVADYEDRDTVFGLLNAEMPTQELAGEILALLTPYSADEAMGLLEQVDESFTASLKGRLTREAEEPSEEELQSCERQIKAYLAYKQVVGGEALYSDRFFQHSGAIGLEFKDYLKLYQSDKEGEDLASADPRSIAKDLVGMAFLSSDGVDSPLIVVRKYLSELFADINVTTKIDVAVSKLTVEVAHAQA